MQILPNRGLLVTFFGVSCRRDANLRWAESTRVEVESSAPDSAAADSGGTILRAATYQRYGDPSVLTVEDVPEPHAGPGQVRIRAEAASVNPVNWKFRASQAAEPLRTACMQVSMSLSSVDALVGPRWPWRLHLVTGLGGVIVRVSPRKDQTSCWSSVRTLMV